MAVVIRRNGIQYMIVDLKVDPRCKLNTMLRCVDKPRVQVGQLFAATHLALYSLRWSPVEVKVQPSQLQIRYFGKLSTM
jgi:hypothetical protein